MTDGTRTRDVRDHNAVLCQLSYGHQRKPAIGMVGPRRPGVKRHPAGGGGPGGGSQRLARR